MAVDTLVFEMDKSFLFSCGLLHEQVFADLKRRGGNPVDFERYAILTVIDANFNGTQSKRYDFVGPLIIEGWLKHISYSAHVMINARAKRGESRVIIYRANGTPAHFPVFDF